MQCPTDGAFDDEWPIWRQFLTLFFDLVFVVCHGPLMAMMALPVAVLNEVGLAHLQTVALSADVVRDVRCLITHLGDVLLVALWGAVLAGLGLCLIALIGVAFFVVITLRRHE